MIPASRHQSNSNSDALQSATSSSSKAENAENKKGELDNAILAILEKEELSWILSEVKQGVARNTVQVLCDTLS